MSGWWLQDEYKAERGAVIAAGATPGPISEVLTMIKDLIVTQHIL